MEVIGVIPLGCDGRVGLTLGSKTVIHTDEDISKVWQVMAHTTRRSAFEFGVNLTRYVLGTYKTLLPRGRTYWPFAVKGSDSMSRITVARVKYGGNYNPEPLALAAFSRRLAALP